MTAPGQSAPDGAYVVGTRYGQDLTEESAKAIMRGGVIGSFENAQATAHATYNDVLNEHGDRIDGAYTLVLAADGKADQAVSDATAAINAANNAESTAAAALEAVSYWETEFVVASAAVTLGVNELLIGPVQNVPIGLDRVITFMHVAMLENPNGLTFELKKWNPDGTVGSVLGTYSMPAWNTRASWAIDYTVVHRERLFINITDITGTVDPQVFQVLVFGAFVETV